MSDFDQALALTLDALSERQKGGADVEQASLESLHRLLEVAAPAVAVVQKSSKIAPPDEAVPSREHSPSVLYAAKRASQEPPDFTPTHGLGLAARARALLEAVDAEPAPPSPKQAPLDALRAEVLACRTCPHLVAHRSNVVFGVGNPDAELMFVGEAPGADEDLCGEPFVGKAGQLLTKIIEAMGFRRGDVYIANILKCRPDMPPGASGNRKPTPAEMDICLPWLLRQIEIIQPRCLVALGNTAAEGLLGNAAPVGKLRGHWQTFRDIPLMSTYHPAYLLRNQSLSEKRKVWEDMLQVLEKLRRPISEKQRGFFLPK